MNRERIFKLPQIPCFNVKFHDFFCRNRTKKVINQDTFQVHWWKHQRGSYKMAEVLLSACDADLMTVLALGLVKA